MLNKTDITKGISRGSIIYNAIKTFIISYAQIKPKRFPEIEFMEDIVHGTPWFCGMVPKGEIMHPEIEISYDLVKTCRVAIRIANSKLAQDLVDFLLKTGEVTFKNELMKSIGSNFVIERVDELRIDLDRKEVVIQFTAIKFG